MFTVRVVLILLLAVTTAGFAANWYLVPRPVESFVVEARLLSLQITGPGLLDATNRVTITARIQGFLTSIEADRNDRVAKGQVLAKLESADLENQLLAARAEEEAARRAVTEAQSERQRAAVSVDKAKDDLDRRAALLQARAVSQAEYATLEAAYRLAQADLSRTDASIARAVAQANAAAANVEVLQAKLNEATIPAPLDGVVISRERNVGDLLTPGATLMQIVEPESIVVSARFDESAMGSIKPGQRAAVSFASEPGREFTGNVLRLSRRVDEETREFTVDITLDDLPKNWAMGQRTNVAIEAQSPTLSIGVPQTYITRRDNRAGVWVARDGRAVWTPVTLGYLSGTEIEVTRGLEVGDVVLQPHQRYPYEPVSVSGNAE